MSASPAPAVIPLPRPRTLKGRPASRPRVLEAPAPADSAQLVLTYERLSITATGPSAEYLKILIGTLTGERR